MLVSGVAVDGALLLNARSVTALTVVVAVAVLLSGMLSVSLALTSALLTSAPVNPGAMCTTIEKLVEVVTGSEPKVQVTVPAVLLQPALADTEVSAAGSTSLTLQTAELESPLL